MIIAMKNFGLMGEEVGREMRARPEHTPLLQEATIYHTKEQHAHHCYRESGSNDCYLVLAYILMTLTFSKIGAEITNQLDLKLHIRYYLSP